MFNYHVHLVDKIRNETDRDNLLVESLWTFERLSTHHILSKKIERYGNRENSKKSFGSFLRSRKLFQRIFITLI